MLSVINSFSLPFINPVVNKVIKRYGIIAEYNGELCMIETSWTPSFRKFLRGQYCPPEFKEIILYLSDNEIDIVKDLLSKNWEESLKMYIELYYKAYTLDFGFKSRNIRYKFVWDKFNGEKFGYNNISKLFFPGGRKEIGETELQCAEREFIEETKITNFKIVKGKVVYKNKIWSPIEYETTYYFAKIFKNNSDFIKNIEINKVIFVKEIPKHYESIRKNVENFLGKV